MTLRHNKGDLPKIKLPLSKSKKQIELNLTPEMQFEIENLVMQLDAFGIMSWKRAQEHIHNFLMANALLNNRKATNKYDLELFKYIFPYYLNSAEISDVSQLNKIIIENPDEDLHTNIETVFKSLGLALDQATQIDPRRKDTVPSTKGIID